VTKTARNFANDWLNETLKF